MIAEEQFHYFVDEEDGEQLVSCGRIRGRRQRGK
jgi:hypothetical protein